jgi:hypothetical protein
MTKIGELRTEKPIESAIKETKKWLTLIAVYGADIGYDARSNIAVLKLRYNDRDYEFRSINQKNCRLNMWGIARVIEFKVRAHLMGIEDFGASMESYKLLVGNVGMQEPGSSINEINYIRLGISLLASNDEIRKKYKQLMKTFHPDMALSVEAKKEFQKRAAEINQAYAEIKKERRME